MSSKKITDLNQMKLAALRGKADTASKVAELAQVVSDAVSDLEATKQDIPPMQTITLAAAGWDPDAKTQTAAVTGVLADQTAQTVSVAPAVEDRALCAANGIDVFAVSDNSMTFSAATVPSADVTVYITIQSTTNA